MSLDIHPLAVCCQVLYDKQVLEDATRLVQLERECKRLEMKFKYAWICQKDNMVYNDYWLHSPILSELISAKFTDGLYCSNNHIIEQLLLECGVHYTITDQAPRRVFHVNPYRDCVLNPCEILLVKSTVDVNRLYLGQKFWKASSFQEQQRVYFFKYILQQIYTYLPEDDVDEGAILFVVHNCLLPYRNSMEDQKWVPQDMLTFEEYIEGDVRNDLLPPTTSSISKGN